MTTDERGGAGHDLNPWPNLLGPLVSGTELDSSAAAHAVHLVLNGRATHAQLAGFAVALAVKRPSVLELYAMARAARAASHQSPPAPCELLLAGTNEGAHAAALSAVAFVVAGTGVPVARAAEVPEWVYSPRLVATRTSLFKGPTSHRLRPCRFDDPSVATSSLLSADHLLPFETIYGTLAALTTLGRGRVTVVRCDSARSATLVRRVSQRLGFTHVRTFVAAQDSSPGHEVEDQAARAEARATAAISLSWSEGAIAGGSLPQVGDAQSNDVWAATLSGARTPLRRSLLLMAGRVLTMYRGARLIDASSVSRSFHDAQESLDSGAAARSAIDVASRQTLSNPGRSN